MKKHMLVSSFAAFLLNLVIFIFLVFLKSPFCLAQLYEDCAPQNCGDGVNVSFPFYIGGLQRSYCVYPGFKLDCNNNGSLIIQISGNDYSVEDIDYSGVNMVLRNSPITTCPSAITNITLDDNDIFSLEDTTKEVIILKNYITAARQKSDEV
ncbi:Concanavalin A-like lectin/glucanase, subgroup [Artemisia annua]|uniref:Concanavalin A-like lectin/glucanase, subgroup n=1 Tax=Artemisia annua TaxID=35608 RepID=A0A2U1MQ94_ARTAN|nr:Concanavalin A-like lectin/glucanase, subgroup [Artemisia annua]